ncbi:MAG: hypothetical protein ACOCQL_03545 [Halolamina sp.]
MGYATATMLAKFQASVADAIHDLAVDASNPEKNRIAAATETLGRRRAWLLLGGYLLLALALYAVVAVAAGAWVFGGGVGVVVLGFAYSYPPRFKERGVWNHVVTTGVDAGLLVLPVAVLVAGRIAPPSSSPSPSSPATVSATTSSTRLPTCTSTGRPASRRSRRRSASTDRSRSPLSPPSRRRR